MKFFKLIILVNLLVVVGVIGFVIWQVYDSGSPLGLIILAIISLGFLGFFVYIGVPRALFRWYIKTTGEPVHAVILECRLGGLEAYSGGTEYSRGTLTAKQAVLIMEIRPANGVPYIAEDQLWIHPASLAQLHPGRKVEAIVSRSNPKWVIYLPESTQHTAI